MAVSAVAMIASTMVGADVGHRHAPSVTAPAQAISAMAMPTIEIKFKLTATETSTGTTGTSTIVDSASTIGVADSNIWSLNAAGIDQNLDELQSIGVTSVRLPIPWTYIESQSGTYDWSQMDTIISAAQARGMSVVGTITGNPAWDGTIGSGQPNVQAYANFAAAVASRYSTEISAFEIWNEENSQGFFSGSNSAAVYTAVLKAAYTAIKAVDPTATVIAGGLAAVANIAGLNQSPESFLSQILADGAAGYFDAIAYHPYNLATQLSEGSSLAESALNQLTALRAALNSYGLSGIAIWATEYGEPTTPGLASPTQQAAYISNFVIEWQALSKTLNLGPAYLYSTRDIASGTLNDENNYGLFYTDGTPKPAALVVAQLLYDLKNNLPLPSLASTIYTLTPGQQVAFVLSEALQWAQMPLTTAAGFAAAVAGAALSTIEAIPPVNMALAAVGAVLNAVQQIPEVKAAVAAVAAAINALGEVGNHVQLAVTTAAFNTVINTVNALASMSQAVGPAVQAAVSALATAAHNTELTVAAAINGAGATLAAAMHSTELTVAAAINGTAATTTTASAKPVAAAATTPSASTASASSITAIPTATVASPAVTVSAAAVSAAAASSTTATSDATSAATPSPAADSSSDTTSSGSASTTKTTTDSSTPSKPSKGKKPKSTTATAATSAAAATSDTAGTSDTKAGGKHRRDDNQRGDSSGPGKHRK